MPISHSLSGDASSNAVSRSPQPIPCGKTFSPAISGGARLNSQEATHRADDVQARLRKRMGDLDLEAQVSALPAVVLGGFVVVPAGLIAQITGRPLDLTGVSCTSRTERLETGRSGSNAGEGDNARAGSGEVAADGSAIEHGRMITLACKEAGITAAAETPKIACRNVASPDCTRSIAKLLISQHHGFLSTYNYPGSGREAGFTTFCAFCAFAKSPS
jgi:hypothetical protein